MQNEIRHSLRARKQPPEFPDGLAAPSRRQPQKKTCVTSATSRVTSVVTMEHSDPQTLVHINLYSAVSQVSVVSTETTHKLWAVSLLPFIYNDSICGVQVTA